MPKIAFAAFLIAGRNMKINTRLYSHPIIERMLPEVSGRKHDRTIMEISSAQNHRCKISGYPYPPLKPAAGQTKETSYLMLDLPGVNKKGEPSSPAKAAKNLKEGGASKDTLITVCPLVFWSQHVDLALTYGRGSLVFTPGISQPEINSIFRTLLVAHSQPEGGGNEMLAREANELLIAFEMTFGRDETLKEAMCLPEAIEWDAQTFLETVKVMPERERTAYLRRFVGHLRFWPNKDAFRPLGQYWAQTAHKPEVENTDAPGNLWVKQFDEVFKAASERVIAPT